MKSILYVIFCMFCLSLFAQESRQWTTKDGKFYKGSFWHVGKGLLSIRTDSKTGTIKLSSLSAPDIAYLVEHKGIFDKSYTLAYQMYMLDHDKNIMNRTRTSGLVNLTINRIVTEDMAIATSANKNFIINIKTGPLKNDQKLKVFLKRHGEEYVDTSDGKLAVYDTYYDFDKKEYRTMLKERPERLLMSITGTTKAYNDWLNKQKKLETVTEEQENRNNLKDKLQKQRLDDDLDRHRDKVINNYEKNLLSLRQKLKKMELDYARLMRADHKNNSVKRSKIRVNITQTKKEITKFEADIRKLKLER